MKCGEEVMDWMQRYVDHELGEEETSQLMNHIATCPDCAEKFLILQTLSRELEELPAVSPAFSLVDSIMPQLDAIDRAREEQGSALQEMQPVAVEPGPVPRQRTQPTPWWNRMAGRAAMGVAAAAVVLGIVVFNFEPKTVQDAEGILTTQSPEVTNPQNQTEITDTANGSGGRDAAIGSDSTQQLSEQGQGTDASQPSADKEPDLSKQGATNADDEKNSSKRDAGKRDDQRAGEEDSTKSTPAEHSSRQDEGQGQLRTDRQVAKENPSAADASKSEDKQLSQEKSDQPTIAPDEQLEPKMEKAPLAGTGTAQDGNNDSTSTNDSSSSLSQELKVQERIASNETSKDTTSKSITKDSGNALGTDSSNAASNDQQSSVSQDPVRKEGFVSNSQVSPDNDNASSYSTQSASTDQLNSPDGSYAVAIEGKKLKVYKLSDNGVDRTTLEVRTLKGAWVKGSWSEDSQTFMYETEQDGTASKYTYTVPRSTGK
ncbi:anti-sigma factor [Paenibacillus polymyxa]|uniref:anti-sigma factor family protein n=1 Tax=Paenibacillus polymyxa TaxID=1406 RepID=UPI0004D3BB2A|nr:anti-sigma factor [Paenibacillus polymyxa]KEO78457.1 transmembrane anti-sigma factor [Paenibacillus polymyxa]MCH6186952.1 anti-sigma factor [Paenibacillus polymyxa]WRL58746.1 anti-sigma factor [Paenibacillus polymyxa]